MGRSRNQNATRWFVLALAFAIALAAADVIFAPSTVLLGLEALPPLLAAARLAPRLTAIVGLVAVGLAIALGAPSHMFATTDHLLRVGLVTAVAILAVWIAALRSARESAVARLAVQHAVARTLAESEGLADAGPRLLREIGELLNWSHGALWLTDEDGRYLRCATQWRQPGTEPTEFDRMTREIALDRGRGTPGRVWAREHPEWMVNVADDPTLPRARAAIDAGLPVACGLPIRDSRGVIGVIEFFTREIRGDEGLLQMMETISAQLGEFLERRRAEQAVRESEALKSAILESALDCVITMDHEGRVVEFNPAAERIFERRSEDVIGREMAELIIPPALREQHRSGVKRAVGDKDSKALDRRLELTGMRSDGSEFPAEITITRIKGADPPLFTGYVRDITARRKSEIELARSKEQLEATLSGVADGVTVQSPSGELIYANDAAAATLGYASVDDLLAAPIEDIMARFEVLDEGGRPFALDQLPGRIALEGQEAPDATLRFRIKETGEERWSVVKARSIRDETGRVQMAINVFEDITDHKRSEQSQRFLAEASRMLATSLDYEDTLDRVSQLAVPGIADWCVVDLVEEDGTLRTVSVAHVDRKKVAFGYELRERFPVDMDADTGIPMVIQSGRAEHYPEIPDELLDEQVSDDEHRELLRTLGMQSAIVAPLSAQGRVLGTIALVTAESGRRLGDDDVGLAEELGRRVGNAVHHARLYRDRAYIATTLQRSLLPPTLPDIPGVELAARFRAAGEGNEVGGDFYDVFEMGGGRWAIVMGDVCGKGAGAAAITALARYTIRAAAMRETLPSGVLRTLNEAMLRDRREMQFCTVSLAILDLGPEGAHIQIASGGHPLPILLRGDGAAEEVGGHGTLLGAVPAPRFQDRRVELEPGDTLLFYTDGVTEAWAPERVLSSEELRSVIASCGGSDADAVAACVEEAVLEMGDADPRDDIAILALQVRGTRGRRDAAQDAASVRGEPAPLGAPLSGTQRSSL